MRWHCSRHGEYNVNETDEARVLMEHTLVMIEMSLDGGKCHQDIRWEGPGLCASCERGMASEGLSEVTFYLRPGW